jgi:hypothetical protein
MFKRLKGRAFKLLVAAIALALVLGGVALIRASSHSTNAESTVQADTGGGGAWGGRRKPRKKKPEEREKEKDSEQSAEGGAYGLAGRMGFRGK